MPWGYAAAAAAGATLGPELLGGGGGGQQQSSTQTSRPEAAPYMPDLMSKGWELANQQYRPYTGERIANFTGLQNKSFTGAENMQVSPYLGQAGSALQDYMGRAANMQYGPSNYTNQFNAPAAYQAGNFAADRVNAPQLTNYQMQGPQDVQAQTNTAAQMSAAQSDYAPKLQNYQMDAPERVGAKSFTGEGTAEQYMSPYMQNVVKAQQREASRASDIQAQQNAAAAVSKGAFGGSRSAVVEAERQRNLATQLGDIQATGQQQAFQNAQQQFNSEQTAGLQAALANQQAGLTAGGQNLAANLGVQQLGTQTGAQFALANLSNQQQANVQNQAAQLQAMGLNSGQALQAALANQGMSYNVGAQNLAANLGVQQLGSGQNMTAQQLNQSAGLQAANMGEQSRQFGYGQGMTAAGMGAQYGQAANQLNEQSRQYGAGLGLQGLQTAGGFANNLGNIGNLGYQQQMGIYGLQNQYGTQQQQQQQNILNQQYQDFQNQRAYPQAQLSWFSNLAAGAPLSTTETSYAPAPSLASQLGGLATAGYGMYRMSGMAEGGMTDSGAGLAELAISKMA